MLFELFEKLAEEKTEEKKEEPKKKSYFLPKAVGALGGLAAAGKIAPHVMGREGRHLDSVELSRFDRFAEKGTKRSAEFIRKHQKNVGSFLGKGAVLAATGGIGGAMLGKKLYKKYKGDKEESK